MASPNTSDFACESCGMRYLWSPTLAGRKVRCACGAEFRCPAAPPADDVIDFVPEPPPTPAPAAIPVAQATLAYRSAPTGPVELDPKMLMTVWVPIWLLAGSIVIEIVATWFRGFSLVYALTYLGVSMIFGTIINMVGILLAVKIRRIDLGSLQTALLRLAAISIAPPAAIELLSPALRALPFIGFIIGLIIEFVLYFALLGAMFDLDEEDTWFCVMAIFLVNLAQIFARLVPWSSLTSMRLFRGL